MNRKYGIVFLVIMMFLVMLTTTCSAQEQVTAKWVYEAINYLNDRPFGDFYTDIDPENRYQVSLAIANTIQSLDRSESSRIQRFGISRRISLQDMIVEYNLTAAEDLQLSNQQILALTALAVEYHNELNVLGYWIEDLSPNNPLDINSQKAEDELPDSMIAFSGNVVLPQPGTGQTAATLNRERVLSKYFGDDDKNTQILINNLIPLWSSDWYIGAGLALSEERDADNEATGYAGIVGEYLINKDVVLEGQYLHNLAQPLDPGILQLGARGRFGNMELRGLVQTQDNEELGAMASLDLIYGGPNSLSIRAGYNANLKTISQLSTSIDVDIPIPQGRIMLGVSQEWNQDHNFDEDDPDKLTDQTKASIEFNYDFSQEMSFKLDYRLIDFSDVDRAFAGFSIRF